MDNNQDVGGIGGTGDGSDASAGGQVRDANDRQDLLDQGANPDDLGPGGAVVSAVRSIDPRPALGLLAVLLAALALAVIRFNWRFRSYGPVESSWAKTRLLASYIGYGAHPSQTTYEFASSLGAAVPDTRDPVKTLAEVRVLEQYSGTELDVDTEESAVTAWHRAASAMLTLLPGRVLRFFTRR